MSYNYDKDFVIKKCTWNPTAGRLYRSYDSAGFFINQSPTLINSRGYNRPHERIYPMPTLTLKHGDIFMYLGGRQSCPDHYDAFRILFGDQVRWLIYPVRLDRRYDFAPINPIRL